MELYIRSQDKMKLVSNCNLYISNEIRNEYVIEDLSNKYLKLGTYKTKERALEVLDEIQIRLMPKKFLNSQGIINPTYEILQEMPIYVYEMPEE